MVLAFYGVERSQEDIAAQMNIRPGLGAPASNIQRLQSRRLRVTYTQGEWQDLIDALAAGVPPILAVHTDQLPYWHELAQHAVVLAGLDGETATVYDPAFSTPQQVSAGDLLLAWDAMGNSFARIEPV